MRTRTNQHARKSVRRINRGKVQVPLWAWVRQKGRFFQALFSRRDQINEGSVGASEDHGVTQLETLVAALSATASLAAPAAALPSCAACDASTTDLTCQHLQGVEGETAQVFLCPECFHKTKTREPQHATDWFIERRRESEMTTPAQHSIDRLLAEAKELAEYLVIDRGGDSGRDRIRHAVGVFAAGFLEIDERLARGAPLPTRWQEGRGAGGGDRERIPPERIDAAFRAARILVHAYQCGFENSGSIPWAQLDDAYEAALEATEDEPRVAEEGAS